mgnify:CR=1 FL=1
MYVISDIISGHFIGPQYILVLHREMGHYSQKLREIGRQRQRINNKDIYRRKKTGKQRDIETDRKKKNKRERDTETRIYKDTIGHRIKETCKYTACPRSGDPFYIVNYYINWVTTSWTYSR